jgi:PTS system mannose-specific IIB component
MIVFTRIDDRVIHGQTMVRWFADYPCDGILIIDDDLMNDTVMSQIYKNAVPNTRVLIFDIETALRKIPEAEASAKRYIVIFKSVLTLAKLVERGSTFTKEVNVGPCSKRPGTIEIVPTISLDKDEINAYEKLSEAHIKVYFQIVPSTKKVWWSDIEKSFSS